MTKTAFTRQMRFLCRPDGCIGVMPKVQAEHALAENFLLPAFPLTQFVWLDELARRFFYSKRRGVAFLLHLDVSTRSWASPAVPPQRCHSDGVSWSPSDEMYAKQSAALYVAGSFQLLPVRVAIELTDYVPAFDGLHFISITNESHTFVQSNTFLRIDGAVTQWNLSELATDDWQELLRQHESRLTIV